MPELPEVENICRDLNNKITNKKIQNVIIRRNKIRKEIPEYFCSLCEEQHIISVKRHAKYILIHLENNYVIIIHLGMSGRILFYNNSYEDYLKHDHVIFKFSDGYSMIFNDPRRFGLIDIIRLEEIPKYFINWGIEPLSEDFNFSLLKKMVNSSRNIKNIIMDGSLVVGIGNIYANETLFRSNILPTRAGNSLNDNEIEKILLNSKTILNEAIKVGGSSLKDYKKIDGSVGNFQNSFLVYGREKKPCFTCNTEIARITQNGRASFYCPTCQK